MKILVTGGNGFIARNIFEQLSGEYSIVSRNSKELNLLDASQVFEYLKNNKFDVVIHTATYDPAPRYSTKDPAKVLENNLKMFFNIVHCKEYFGKLLYFGSGAEFDRENWVPKMREDYFDRYIPKDQYGFSKYIMTRYTMSNSNIYNLRVFSVFGKYEDWRYRIISKSCCCAISDVSVTIKQNKYFDFLYIDDLVKIVKWFIDNDSKHKVYNICSGEVINFKTAAEKVVQISGKKINIIISTEGLDKEYSGDNTLLLNELKGFEFTPIDMSIKALYDWYNLNKQIIDKKEL